MKRLYLAVVIALLLVACSQTSEVAPELSPQFGTAGYDTVEYVAVDEGGIYLGGERNDKPALVKFSRAGGISWTRSLASTGDVFGVALSSVGDVYALYRIDNARYAVRKYTQSGTLVWTRKFTNPSGSDFNISAPAVDAHDNVYLSFATYETPRTSELRKYNSDGTLLYRTQLSEPIFDLAVTPDGTTYTTSIQHLTRYTPQGQQVWQKTLPFAAYKVAVGTSSQIYVGGYDSSFEKGQLLAKYSSSGSKSWQRTVSAGSFSNLRGLAADTEGHVFVGVSDRDDPYAAGDSELSFGSYDAAGTLLAERTLDLGEGISEVDVGEISALSATEVYLGGSIYKYEEDSDEGFLVRLNGLTGTVTWQR